MKRDLILSSGLLILLIVMIGATIFLPASAVVEASVKFDPDKVDLGAPGWTYKEGIIATVWFEQRRYKVKDVDPKTILLDGVLEPKGGWKHGVWIERDPELKRDVLRILFSGSSVIDLIWLKIFHEGMVGNVKDVPLTITGNFYDGDPFEGTGFITVIIPSNPPPPPPPGP